MKKIAIIANRSSGKQTAVSHTLLARAKLWGRPLVFHFPKSVQELGEICLQITPEHYEALVIIGGDGTLNQVIRSLSSKPNLVPIYPFPGGTANDLAKELGIEANWDQLQTLLDQRQFDLIDLIEVNGVPFSTVGGIGIGSILTEEFNRRRSGSLAFGFLSNLLNSHIYTFLSAKTILLRRDYIHHLHVKGSGFNERIRTPAVFICNQDHLGGDLKVAPSLDNTDKKFNVLIVTTSKRGSLLTSMAQLKRGKLPPNFFVFSTDELVMTDLDGKKIRVFGDGEPLLESTQLKIRILPKSLKVFRKNVEEKNA
jgi:diacylglycerol kinase (ATP)